MKRTFTFLLLALTICAFSTDVTFLVSMKGSGMDYDTVYIVGDNTDWDFIPMIDMGDSVYSVTLDLTEGDSLAYYYITNNSWTDYEAYRETVPDDCDFSTELSGWDGDRALVVPENDTTISYIWGSCDEVPELTSASVTFKVCMKGSGMDYDTVFIVGDHTDWEFLPMADIGDSVWALTMILSVDDTAAYYYITNNSWTGYEDYRETVPPDCDQSEELMGWEGDRAFIVPAAAITLSSVWSSCEEECDTSSSVGVVDQVTDVMRLFPNPATEFVTLVLPESKSLCTVELFDISGKLCRSIEFKGQEVKIGVADLQKGIYLVKVSDGKDLFVQKLIRY